MDIIDGLILACGFYMLYQTVIMRKEGYIPEGFMLTKGTVLPKDADVAGFILNMTWKGIVLGISACISGVLGMASTQLPQLDIIATIFYFVFFAIIVVFIVFLKKAQKKYLNM